MKSHIMTCVQRNVNTNKHRGKTGHSHKNSLPETVLLAIKPIFQDLAHPDLLQKCLKGYTQNANKSLNNLIWKYAPKKKHHGLVTVNTAVSLAVGIFNDGAVTLSLAMRELQL